MKKNRKGKKQIIFVVPESLHEKFRVRVIRDKKVLGMSEVMRNLVEAYTEKRLDCQGQAK